MESTRSASTLSRTSRGAIDCMQTLLRHDFIKGVS